MHEGIWQEKQLTWSDILQDLPELLLHFDAQLQRDSCVYNQAYVINTVSKTHQRCSIFHLREFFMRANQYKNIVATACRAWARAETFNGLQKVLQILCVPGPTTL